MVIGIVLAGGKGTRLGLQDKNKNSVLFNEKPLISYAVDLYKQVCDEIIIVTGHHAKSIESLFTTDSVLFAHQATQLGTGHAAKIALQKIKKEKFTPDYLFIGYGDHMMFYTPELLTSLLEKMKQTDASVGLLSTRHTDPNSLAWGRLVQGEDGHIERIVEQKNATEEERNITLINPGFYCVTYQFANYALNSIKVNPLSKEYYLTDIVEIANQKQKKVVDLEVPFEQVGIGINTASELTTSEKLYLQTHQ